MEPTEVKCILPDELVYHHILSRLPVRDLLRFRCVCKDWCAFIDSPSFITHHYQVQYSIAKLDGNLLHFVDDLRNRYNGHFCLLSIHQGNVSAVDLNAEIDRDCLNTLSLCRDQGWVSTYGCVNGVILFKFSFEKNEQLDCLGLWNPSTREFKSVAYPFSQGVSSDLSIHGFGFDMISNDFKILGTYRIAGKHTDYHEVYSLGTNSWKQIGFPPTVSDKITFNYTDGYLNGVHYWYWYGFPEDESEISWVVVTFYYNSEIYSVSDFPEGAKPLILSTFEIMITLYKESIGLFVSQKAQAQSLWYKVDVWVVTKFDASGVPLSWQHLFTVGPTLTKDYLEVAAARVDGDLLLRYMYETSDEEGIHYNVGGEEYLYNPSKAEFKYFRNGISYYYMYIESLFRLSNRSIEA